MLEIPACHLTSALSAGLAKYQSVVNLQQTYALQISVGIKNYGAYNKPNNPIFGPIRQLLSDMCNGPVRCMYCEDSVADEIEHFWPKSVWPDYVFVWDNYLYACGPCNGAKLNAFTIFDPGSPSTRYVVPKGGKKPTAPPPPHWNPMLIDPRSENPLNFMMLDLMGTFNFVPIGVNERADFTIKTLGLNARRSLVKARESAFLAYRALLHEYGVRKANGASAAVLKQLMQGIMSLPHRTVWEEMKRQRIYAQHTQLNQLFAGATEALNW
jgi:hypothetical protein